MKLNMKQFWYATFIILMCLSIEVKGEYALQDTDSQSTIYENIEIGHLVFESIGDKTYGDVPFELNGYHTQGKAVIFESSDPSIVSIAENIATIKKAGFVVITMSLADNNDTENQAVFQEAVITKAPLNVSALDQIRGFGQPNPDVSNGYCIRGYINQSDASDFITMPTAYINQQYGERTQPGAYSNGVLVSGGYHPNYTLIYTPGVLTIEEGNNFINFTPFCNKEYGEFPFVLSASHINGLPVNFESLDSDIVSVSRKGEEWIATIHHIGTATIRAYTDASAGAGIIEKKQSITIEPTELIITPNDVTRHYGKENPSFGLSFHGLKYNDTKNDFGTINISTTATIESQAGLYPIVASGAINDNYIIKYTEGTLTVEKAILSISMPDDIATYTGNPLMISPSVILGTVGNIVFPVTYSYQKEGYIGSYALDAGTYTVNAEVTGDQNHEAASTSATFRVNKATPQIQLTGITTEYTGNPVSINTPVITGSTTAHALNYVIKYKGTGETIYPETTNAPINYGTYEVTASTEGNNNHNPASSTTSITIGKKVPQMNIIAENKSYDKLPLNATAYIEPQHLDIKYSYEGVLKDGSLYDTSEQAPTEAGNYTVTASTEGDQNYSPTSVSTNVEIMKTEVGIEMNNKSTPFNGAPVNIEPPVTEPTNLSLDITYIGIGETNYPESATAPTYGGTYLVKASFDGNNNYFQAQAIANLTITNAGMPTLALDNKIVSYNGKPQDIGDVRISPEYAEYLPVTYMYSNANYPATETPPTNAGVYNVTATTPADENFKMAWVTATLTINKAEQNLSFPELGTRKVEEGEFKPQISIDSELPLTYSSGNTKVATVTDDGTIVMHKSGTVTITVTQEGNENYEPIVISRILNVTSSDATIHQLTINGQLINVSDKMHHDLLCDKMTDFRIIVETEANASVNTGKLFNVIVDKPMLKVIELIVTSQDRTQTKTYLLTIEKRFEFDAIVKTRWNNALTVINNPDHNGGYRFTTFKWFKNGQELATGQSYSAGSQGELLLGTDKYYLELTSNDFEGTLRSCEGYPDLRNQNIKAYPNPLNGNETVYVKADVEDELLDGAIIEVYNLDGIKIKQIKVQGRLTPVNINKATAGTYIFRLKGKDGFSKDLRVIVK